MDADVESKDLSLLGAILSHGYLVSGFLPLRVAFPSLAGMLIGPSCDMPPGLLVEAYVDSISTTDGSRIKECLKVEGNYFSQATTHSLFGILSRSGIKQLPTPKNIQQHLLKAAKYEFINKPFAALTAINQGIPSTHYSFWQSMGIVGLWKLYLALSVTPTKVLEFIQEPECCTSHHSRVFDYLTQMIGSMNQDELRTFLRFVTGCSVCIGPIEVIFNSLSGFARRPIAHTCSCQLELPSTYVTYMDFCTEFQSVLSTSEWWRMDAL